MRFLEACSYQLDDNRIIIYIKQLKQQYSAETVRKHILAIRRFLKFINYPLADSIKIPNVPERRKTVIKPHHIRNLINEIDEKVKYAPLRLKARAAILLSATSGMRAEEVYKLSLDNIDLENRMIFIPAEISKSYKDRITFFSEETKEILLAYFESNPDPTKLFTKYSLRRAFDKLNTSLRMKHMRKFFSQQSDRLGMPTAVKKILMGHVVGDDDFVVVRGGDVDLSHYDFQDEEELKKIYDKYWRDFRIFSQQ